MPPSGLRPALFLDRDGVLIENRPGYVRSLDDVVFIPGVAEALAQFQRARPDWRTVVISNQAGIGHGVIPRGAVEAIHAHLRAHLQAAGARLDAIYVCPHRPDENCACRKPKPGLILQAAAEWQIDLPASILIGDSATDVQAARAAGVTPLFVQSGLPERLSAEQALAEGLDALVRAHLPAALQHLLAVRAARA